MDKLKAFTTVYSYPTPEVLAVVREIIENYPIDTIEEGWVRKQLTEYHKPIFEELINLRQEETPGLGEFEQRYPTYGSDHAICEYLSYLRVEEGVRFIYVLQDDYEGYIERARSRGIETRFVSITTNPKDLESGIWFISNPSARDGNILPDRTIEDILAAGHRVVYDLAYLGTTDDHQFDLSHENIDGALVSFSKPYGLFSHRIGFSFFRRRVPSLEANALWFKNIFGLTLARQVIADVDHESYAATYKAAQRAIVDSLAEQTGLPLKASDAFLLAHVSEDAQLTEQQRDVLKPYRRGNLHRLCLTPYFFELNEPAASIGRSLNL